MRLFLLLACLGPVFLFAQDASRQLSGTVTDLSAVPLPGAQLVYYQGQALKGYTLTDADGRFALDVPNPLPDSSRVEARYFGYETVTFAGGEITADRLASIRLKQGGVDLKEVTVSADALPQVQRGDTISFRTSAYRDGSEDKIEDVIAKLPGVEVADNGKITINGKPLDRILLDGEDVFDKNYKLLSRNVPAGYVDQIDVLNDYQPDELVGDLTGGGETALDLKLGPDRKGILFGELSAAAGTEDYRDVRGSLFLLRKKVKLVNFTDYTTTGLASDAAGGLRQSLGATGTDRPLGQAVFTSPAARPVSPVSAQDYLTNSAFGSAQSVLHTPTDGIRNRLMVSLGRDEFDWNDRRERILRAGGTNDTFLLRNQFDVLSRDLWLKDDLNLMVGPQSRIDLSGTLRLSDGRAASLARTDQSGESLTKQSVTDLDNISHGGNAELKYTTRLSARTAFTLSGNYGSENYDQQQRYAGSVYEDLGLVAAAGPFSQRLEQRYRNYGTIATLLTRIGGFRVQQQLGLRAVRVESVFSLLPDSEPETAPDRFDYGYDEADLTTNIYRKWNKWTARATGGVKHYRFDNDNSSTGTLPPTVAPQAAFHLERKFGRRSVVTANASYDQRPTSNTEALPFTYLSGQSGLDRGADSLFLMRRLSAGLSYRYNNTYRQYGYGAGIRRENLPDALRRRLTVSDFLFVNQLQPGGESSVTTLTANGHAYAADIKTQFKASFRAMRFTDKTDFAETAGEATATTIESRVDVGSVISRKLKSNLTVRHQVFSNVFLNQEFVQQQAIVSHTTVWMPTTKWKVVNKYQLIVPQLGGQTDAIHILRLLTTFSPDDGPWSFSAGVNNLLNQGSVLRRDVAPALVTAQSFRLRGRLAYLGIKYKF